MSGDRLAEPGDAVVIDDGWGAGIGVVVELSPSGTKARCWFPLVEESRTVGVYRSWLEVISTPKDREIRRAE